jgi:hypothetical protein
MQNNDIKTRRHPFHHNVRKTVLGAGLCTLSNFPHTLIDQALSLTLQGKNIIYKLSPERTRAGGERPYSQCPTEIFTHKIATDTYDHEKYEIAADTHDHESLNREQVEKRSPVSSECSESFNASEKSFNPENYEECDTMLRAVPGHIDVETEMVSCDKMIEQTIVHELAKRYFPFFSSKCSFLKNLFNCCGIGLHITDSIQTLLTTIAGP